MAKAATLKSTPAKPAVKAKSPAAEIKAAEKALAKQLKALAALKRKAKPEAVEDAVFVGQGGNETRLSDLFGAHDELILIHNMGRSCPYCTLWADGFNGYRQHLENRAAFIVVSPDAPDKQAEFAKSRGWAFKMLSDPKGRFSASVGFGADGGIYPGVSTFRRRNDGSIERVASAQFGPGDIYNPAFHLFDLLPGASKDWLPKFNYA